MLKRDGEWRLAVIYNRRGVRQQMDVSYDGKGDLIRILEHKFHIAWSRTSEKK